MISFFMDQSEVALRLFAAVACGSVVGLNRFLRRKSAGMRTHGLVALGAAMATVMASQAESADAVSRVAQGLVTGVGFIGAGVIMRSGENRITGLTTAASIWASAILGICCGAAAYSVALIGVAFAMFVLMFGKRIETGVAHLLKENGTVDEPEE